MTLNITRRSFLQSGSLVIAATFFTNSFELLNVSRASAASELTFKPHAFLEIGKDDTITIWMGQTNLGQGTHTGIPMIITDELDGDWEKVEVKMALAAEPFKDPQWHAQLTGGSTSIRHRWNMLRQVGAAARQMLIETAAEQWGIPASQCLAKESKVYHPGGKSLSYGELTEAASKRAVPENPQLKEPREYKIIGTARKRTDIPDKVMGKTVYGIDVALPDMCIAVVARPITYGAVPQSYDEPAAMAIKGVIKVIPFDDKIAVCAKTTYAAMQGRDALKISWSPGSHPNLNDESLDALFAEHLEKPGALGKESGDALKALAEADKILEEFYKLPYISHAQVEPINCTAHVEKERCRIWVPTQGQTTAQMTAAKLTGLPPEKVEVMTTFVGGGFGLRGEPDPVIDSVILSKAMNRPVKVIWSREDDFANDYFRPGSQCRIKAGLDKEGKLLSWSHKVAAPSIMNRVMPQYIKNGIDSDAINGVVDMPYSIPNMLVEYVMLTEPPIPVGWWRSVGYSVNVFTVESVIDELAHTAGKDPLQFRLEHLKKESRPYKLLSFLAEKGGWDTPVAGGRARGVALASCFESVAAHIAEVSVDSQGKLTVHKMVAAVDCGTAVYPDAIAAQAEGGIIMGLSVALHEKVHFENGGVKTANYDQYPVLSMSEVPEIEVHIISSNLKAGGIGEPVFPSVAPAVANAVFKATGVRLRELPFKTDLLIKG